MAPPRLPFEHFYKHKLQARLDELELDRRAMVIQKKVCVISLASGFLGFTLLGQFKSDLGLIFTAILAILFLLISAYGIFLAFQSYRSKHRFRGYFKQVIVRSIIEYLNPGLRYDPVGGIRREVYELSGLFPRRCDRYMTEDHVGGKSGHTAFEFSELHTQRKVKRGKRTHFETIFWGLFLVADFNKEFQGSTFVRPDTAERAFGSFGRTLQRLTHGNGLVELENPKFEENFVVESTDQIEARYILTPALMENIVKLQNNFDTEIHISFVKKHMYLALGFRKNLLEPRSDRAYDLSSIRSLYFQIRYFLEIIDNLDLNTRIWTKRPKVG